MLLAAAVLAAGCAPNGETTPPPAANAASAPGAGFRFAGDFRGPLGVQLYSFRREMAQDVPGTLRRVRALGFQEVETAGTYGMTPAQFRQELDRAGLRATAMHTGYERLRDSLPAVLAEAKTLGAQYVGTAWIPRADGKPLTVEQARQVAADFNRWGRAAREQGLQFFYHIHGYEFVPGTGGLVPMDVLMQQTDPEAVKFEMDVFWAALPGVDPAALLRRYPDRWELMHIKDMRSGVPTPNHAGTAPPDETEVPVGTGQINYREVLKAAQEIGLDKFYIEDETRDPFGSVAQSLRFLQTVDF